MGFFANAAESVLNFGLKALKFVAGPNFYTAAENQIQSKIPAIATGFLAAEQKLQGVVAQATLINAEKAAEKQTFSSVVFSGAKNAASTVATTVGNSFVKAPIATTAGVLVGVPVVVGIVKSNPSIVTSLPSQGLKAGEAIGNFVKDNPTTSVALAGAGLVGGLIAAAEIASSKTKNEITLPSSPTAVNLPTAATSQPSTAVVSSPVPLTAATQIAGKQVQPLNSIKRRKKARKKEENQKITLNVIQANQSRISTNRNYLNKYSQKY